MSVAGVDDDLEDVVDVEKVVDDDVVFAKKTETV
jgi:hypothetical protein